MSIVLPKAPIKAEYVDPRILLLYGPPKVGKTGELVKLPGCLILDGEKGTKMHDALKVEFDSSRDLREVKKAIIKEGEARAKEGKKGDDLFPYTYLAIDTIDNVEDFAIASATAKYKASTIGKSFEGDSVLELPKGGGYYYLREEVKDLIKEVGSVCKNLIIISHLREKNYEKGGMDVQAHDISLMGKLGEIVCGMADAIGYMYRKSTPGHPDQLMISFRTGGKSTIGSRAAHLRGQTFEFDWSKIYTEDPNLKPKQ